MFARLKAHLNVNANSPLSPKPASVTPQQGMASQLQQVHQAARTAPGPSRPVIDAVEFLSEDTCVMYLKDQEEQYKPNDDAWEALENNNVEITDKKEARKEKTEKR